MPAPKIRTDDVESVVYRLCSPEGPFPVAEREINGITFTSFTQLPESLGEMYKAAQLHGEQPFIVYGQQRTTFLQTYKAIAVAAAALVERYQITKGDRVAICMQNSPEWCVAFMAITSIGAVAVPLNSWWKKDEMRYAIEDCGAKLLFTDERRLSYIEDVLNELQLSVVLVAENVGENASTDEAVTNWHEFMQRSSGEMPNVNVKQQDLAIILYTSGSTGKPKGVVSNHFQILSVLYTWLALFSGSKAVADAMNPENSKPVTQHAVIQTVPLFHVTGCYAIFLLSFLVGRKVVFMRKWDAGEALKIIEQEKITHFNGVPTMSMEVMLHPDIDKYDLSSLEDVSAGGAARPPSHVQQMKAIFPEATSSLGYGLTETNAGGCFHYGEDYNLRPNSVGRATVPVTEIKIVGNNGEVLPAGVDGEIWIKTPAVALGYWNNPEATRESFVDGWFKTGDQGHLDEKRYLYITGRIKEIIIRGGENISCNEVEAALHQHPNIREAAVFGLPDERLGEIVAAAIVPKQGELAPMELQEFLAEKLANYKIPTKMLFKCGALPRLGTGKVDKKTLKAEFP